MCFEVEIPEDYQADLARHLRVVVVLSDCIEKHNARGRILFSMSKCQTVFRER